MIIPSLWVLAISWTAFRAAISRSFSNGFGRVPPEIQPLTTAGLSAPLTKAPRELRQALVLDYGFNDRSTERVVQNYLKTLDYAGLRGGRPEEEKLHPAPLPPPPPAVPFELSLTPPPAASQLAPVTFPLLDGNAVEFKIQRKIRSEEAEEVRALFEIWLRKIVIPE